MTDRLTSTMLVGALIRSAQAQGGNAMVLAKGDATSGAILIQTIDRGRETGIFERTPDYASGGYHMVAVGPASDSSDQDRADYFARRRHSDPDLWIIELDIADGERFAAVTMCG